ncbi:unnamed protein product [Alternaria alternata]
MARLIVTLLAAAAVVPSRLLFPGQDAYETREDSYFDVKQQVITPNCIVQPKTAKEVALAVKTLTAASLLKSCKFAIRSAGHTPYAGASNIEDGVTLDLRYLNTVQYDAKNTLVKVGPAATWDDVYNVLEPLNVMTSGGRSSTVGVGGLTLGGGVSYFSPGRGLVCDNVIEFEVVLADGRIVTASKTSHPDLFAVLKGGNNNFGVVTSFKFGTFDYNGLWGGLVIYPESTIQDHFKALINFSNNIDKQPKGSAIVMPVYQSSAGADLILNAVYFGTLTFANDLRVMTKAHEIYMDIISNLKAKATGDWQIYVLYQPLPPSYWRQSASKGGNMLGLERFGEQVLCLYQPYISWQGAEQDALFQGAGADLVNRIREYAESIGADNPYLYLNYADNTQDPLASYGSENVKKMKAAAKKYDPFSVFQKLVPGGFKISNVR